MTELTKALPGEFIQISYNRWTEPFWRAAREQRLVAPRCGACGRFRMPPSPFCPDCLSQDVDWITLSGDGVVYSYTVCTRTPFAGHENLTFAPAVVELPDAQGVRLIGDIVGARVQDIRIGMAVRVAWNPVKDGENTPIFTPR